MFMKSHWAKLIMIAFALALLMSCGGGGSSKVSDGSKTMTGTFYVTRDADM